MEENAKVWAERTACAGFDGASEQHDLVVVDRHGTVLHSFRIDDTADGWAQLRQRWSPYADLAIAVETSCGAQDDQPVKCYEEPTNENPKNALANRENISGRRVKGFGGSSQVCRRSFFLRRQSWIDSAISPPRRIPPHRSRRVEVATATRCGEIRRGGAGKAVALGWSNAPDTVTSSLFKTLPLRDRVSATGGSAEAD